MAKTARASAEQTAAADLTPEDIGGLCAAVVTKYARPNINARTMMLMPEFWADISKALRGETVEDLTPALVSIEPDNAPVGGEDVTLRAIGTNFTEESIIVFNSGEETTTFVSDTEVTTTVRPSTASGPISVPVSVKTGEVYTDPLQFTFTEADAPVTTMKSEDEDEDKSKSKSKSKRSY